MDPEMAFIMCNQAHIRQGSLVFDPYVGTGSILVAAAQRGAYVLGADIDPRVIREGKLNKATGQRSDIYSNFEQYGLQWPVGLLRMDAHRPPFRQNLEEVGFETFLWYRSWCVQI
jgi:tRNA (guanine10-N2)-methyltransferase